MARTFDSTPRHLHSSTPPVTAAPFTISIFTFESSDPANDTCAMQIQDKDVTNNQYRLGRTETPSDGCRFVANEGSAQLAVSANDILIGVWNHMCARAFASDSRDVVLNADFANKGTNTNESAPAGLDSIDIGLEGDSSPADAWVGQLAELAIWDVALSDADVQALNDRVSPWLIRPDARVSYWPLWGTTSPEIDVWGGNHIALVNAPPRASHPRIILPSVAILVPAAVAAAPALGIYPQVSWWT